VLAALTCANDRGLLMRRARRVWPTFLSTDCIFFILRSVACCLASPLSAVDTYGRTALNSLVRAEFTLLVQLASDTNAPHVRRMPEVRGFTPRSVCVISCREVEPYLVGLNRLVLRCFLLRLANHSFTLLSLNAQRPQPVYVADAREGQKQQSFARTHA
jgi:hypothetical protein